MVALNNLDQLLAGSAFRHFLEQHYAPQTFGHQERRFAQMRNQLIEIVSSHGSRISFPQTADAASAAYERRLEGRIANLYRAPGRIEIIGNHTDHQLGVVICAAIDDDVIVAASQNRTNEIRIVDAKKSLYYTVNLDSLMQADYALARPKEEKWKSLVDGVVAGFKEKGYKVGGFDLSFYSDVLPGSGTSSSAALTMAISTALNHEFNEGKISADDLSLICQQAEHKYFGKDCGLMDQNASARGDAIYINFAKPNSPLVLPMKQLVTDLDQLGYKIAVVNTGGNHEGLNKLYGAIGADMRSVAKSWGYDVLSQVPLEKRDFNKITNQREWNRACHYYAEVGDVEMVRAMYQSLKAADSDPLVAENYIHQAQGIPEGRMNYFLWNVMASGNRSESLLGNLINPLYDNADLANQPLAVGYHMGKLFLQGKKGLDGRLGAVRLMGGGFAGTTLAFIPSENVEEYAALMNDKFGDGAARIYQIRPGAGKIAA